jgi:hypothetical protein
MILVNTHWQVLPSNTSTEIYQGRLLILHEYFDFRALEIVYIVQLMQFVYRTISSLYSQHLVSINTAMKPNPRPQYIKNRQRMHQYAQVKSKY